MFISHSHNLGDAIVWRALSRAAINCGCYIDVGADLPPESCRLERTILLYAWSKEAIP